MGDKIRYLRKGEKQQTKPMYEAVFSEDSQRFVDYYYNWKIRDNQIIVMEGTEEFEDSSLQVMLHLNPYTVSINRKSQDISYIVAVATASQFRRQGKMRQVMEYTLQDMERREVPFTFLLPADPVYYSGQGFVFFPCQGLASVEKDKIIKAASAEIHYKNKEHLINRLRWKQAQVQDVSRMALFSNKILGKRCNIFIKRDCYYYQRLLVEMEVEHGGILMLEAKGQLFGLLTYAFVKQTSCGNTDGSYEESVSPNKVRAEIKELLLETFLSQKDAETLCREAFSSIGINDRNLEAVTFSESQMMVRITDLQTFVPLLRSERGCSFSVKVRDSIVGSNCGCYGIQLTADEGRIKKISEKNVQCKMDIAELTRELLRDTSVYLNEWV